MALIVKLETLHGEERELYVRVNNFDQLTNHDEGGPDQVRFRGYLDKAAFDARKHYVWELLIEAPIDVARPPWPQAYAALKAHDPTAALKPPPDFREQLPALTEDSPPDVVKAHADAGAEYEAALAAYSVVLAEATRLRDALRAGRDV